MAEVRIERPLAAPPALAFQALEEILRAIAEQQTPWHGFPLHVELADAGFADVGYVAIPIALEIKPHEPGLQQIDVTIRAARHPESFPVFAGKAGVDVTGPSATILWIAGAYDVPMHGLGKFLDATLARGLAQRSLENLLEDLDNACRALIDKRQGEYIRYHLFDRAR